MPKKNQKNILVDPVALVRNVRYWVPRERSPERHTFILGAPRSGTNLIKMLLTAHPELGGCDYESTGVFNFRDIYQYRTGHFRPKKIDQLRTEGGDLVGFYDRLTAAILARKGKQRFVDKLKFHPLRLRYVHRVFPEARFIHMVRDGRDAFCSARRHPDVRQSEDVRTFAAYWKKHVSPVARLIDSERLRELRYEDLTADPERQLRAIMAWLGLDFDPQQLSPEHYGKNTTLRRREVHQNLAKPVQAYSQYRWKTELTDAQNAAFLAVAGEQLTRFGYEREPPPPYD